MAETPHRLQNPSSSSTPQHINPYRDPYFLSATDIPGAALVTEVLKDESNYELWSNQMENQLMAKNKWGFVDGSFPRPKSDAEKQQAWDLCCYAVQSWFQKSVSHELMLFVTRKKDLKLIWEIFKTRFGTLTGTQLYRVRQKQFANNMDAPTVSEYYMHLSNLWLEIETVDPPIRCHCGNCSCRVNERADAKVEKHRTIDFLLGLPDKFRNFRTNVLSKDPLPSVDAVFNLAKEDEHQARKEELSAGEQGIALAVTSPANSGASGAKPKLDSKGRTVCSHCHKSGHSKDQCYQLVGYPPGWMPRGRGKKAAGGQAFQAGSVAGSDVISLAGSVGQQSTGQLSHEAQNITGFGGPHQLGPIYELPQQGSSYPGHYMFYPGGPGPVPLISSPSHGLPSYGLQGQGPHVPGLDQAAASQNQAGTSFAGSMCSAGPPLPSFNLNQLRQNLPSQLLGNFEGPYDWAGDRTG